MNDTLKALFAEAYEYYDELRGWVLTDMLAADTDEAHNYYTKYGSGSDNPYFKIISFSNQARGKAGDILDELRGDVEFKIDRSLVQAVEKANEALYDFVDKGIQQNEFRAGYDIGESGKGVDLVDAAIAALKALEQALNEFGQKRFQDLVVDALQGKDIKPTLKSWSPQEIEAFDQYVADLGTEIFDDDND